jgi:hypothetical protein
MIPTLTRAPGMLQAADRWQSVTSAPAHPAACTYRLDDDYRRDGAATYEVTGAVLVAGCVAPGQP